VATPTPECATVGNPANLPTIGTVLRWIDNSNFLYIPEGEFIMGAASTEPEDFNPQHVVFLDDFWMQEAEVTNQQYAGCVEAGACTPPFEEEAEPYRYADPTYAGNPVVGVDWLQA
jgi:formylglycine-generating enzyme required for sulfatase activity